MSYDLIVFDPAAAPRKRAEILQWFEEKESQEDAPSDDPQSLTPALRAWFMEMIETFPPMNGPLAKDENMDDPTPTDYGLRRTYIHACFPWSQAEEALLHTARLAEEHRVGVYNISSKEGGIWIPGAGGELEEIGD